MDTRRLLMVMLLVLPLVFLSDWALTWYAKKQGWDLAPKPQSASTQPVAPDATTQQVAHGAAPAATGAAVIETAKLRPVSNAGGGSVTLGSSIPNDPKYPLAVTVNAAGAGLDLVTLNAYKRVADADDRYQFQQPYSTQAASTRSLATQSITLNGFEVPSLATAAWTLESSSVNSAVYSITIGGDDGPVARLIKTYQLANTEDVTRGYEIIVTQSIENLTSAPLTAKLKFNGPNVPPRESDRGGERYILGGYLYKGIVDVHHDAIEGFTKDQPTKELIKDKNGNPILWFGAASTYFQALVRPVPSGDPSSAPEYIASITGNLVDANARPEDHAIVSTVTTTDLTVAPGAAVAIPLRVFLGPRLRQLLNQDYYASFPLSYEKTLVLTSGPCGICTFQWLINILVSLLRFFQLIVRDWGLAIIALVVLVRTLLHPITKKSQIAMAKMGKLGPEMERLKKKYGDNKEELTKAMWQLQKEQGMAGAYMGCLPMFLQMPIWIALWQSLQTTFELRQAPFLWGWTWIHDLAKPDHLITFDRPFELWFLHFSGLNVLPILMGAVFWLQMKFQPKPATMTKEQEQQQRMMMFMMPFLFPLMLYSGPSGLNLYILTSTAIGIVESKIVRDHIKQREEAEKAGRVIVDARPTRGSRHAGAIETTSTPAQKAGCVGGWLSNLQKYAEQVQRDAQNKPKK